MKNGNLSAPFKSSARKNAANFKGMTPPKAMPNKVSWSKTKWPPKA